MKFPTLYKRSVTGKISTWYVEVKDNCFRTVSGFEDGQKVTSEWTECEGKNIGKSNETNPARQADAEAKAMFDKRLALGYFKDIKDIDKLVYFKPMLAHNYKEYKDELVFPVFSQPKLDGIRCITKADGMWTRNGKQIISAPHIFNVLQPMFQKYPDMVLDGELYAEKEDADFNMIISCVRKTKPTLKDLKISQHFIRYHVYDLPSEDGIFKQRIDALDDLFHTYHPFIKVVMTTTIQKNERHLIPVYYAEYIEQGYEGQMIRMNTKYENKRTKSLLKDKVFVDAEFEIKGVVEGIGNLSGKVGKLQFEINGKPFNAAVNGDHEYLAKLLRRNDLVGKQATVKYFELTPDGIPRFGKVIAIRDFE